MTSELELIHDRVLVLDSSLCQSSPTVHPVLLFYPLDLNSLGTLNTPTSPHIIPLFESVALQTPCKQFSASSRRHKHRRVSVISNNGCCPPCAYQRSPAHKRSTKAQRSSSSERWSSCQQTSTYTHSRSSTSSPQGCICRRRQPFQRRHFSIRNHGQPNRQPCRRDGREYHIRREVNNL